MGTYSGCHACSSSARIASRCSGANSCGRRRTSSWLSISVAATGLTVATAPSQPSHSLWTHLIISKKLRFPTLQGFEYRAPTNLQRMSEFHGRQAAVFSKGLGAGEPGLVLPARSRHPYNRAMQRKRSASLFYLPSGIVGVLAILTAVGFADR